MENNQGLFGLRYYGDLENGCLEYLEQSKLPHTIAYRPTQDLDTICSAIRNLDIRGAPAIAIAGAFAVALGFYRSQESDYAAAFDGLCEFVLATRRTAVDLTHAIERLRHCFKAAQESQKDRAAIAQLLFESASALAREDATRCARIALAGAPLLTGNVLTHCNTGALATYGIGTAIGCIMRAHHEERISHVYATATFPALQGARLTMPELMWSGVPSTLIVESVVGMLMAQGKVSCVIVGADRIGRDGHVINKIGTYVLALCAQAHGIPFYVAAPRTTFDSSWTTDVNPPIEERAPQEVLRFLGDPNAIEGMVVYNPVFDITPAGLVTAYITDVGVHRDVRDVFKIIANTTGT